MPFIGDIIKQSVFEDPRQQVLVNVLYSAIWGRTLSNKALKPFKLSWQQFNLMRILKGQKGEPATMRLLSERMLDPQSNASRIVDKLVEKNYVSRITCPDDRRQVRVALTEEGNLFLAKASEAVRTVSAQYGGDLTESEMLQLSDLLDRFRNKKN